MLLKVLENFMARFELPIEFYLNGLVFIMLFSASGVFLLMTHVSDEDDQPEDMVE